MRNWLWGFSSVALALSASTSGLANEPAASAPAVLQGAAVTAEPAAVAPEAPQEEALGAVVRRRLAKGGAERADEERSDALALAAFYESRKDEPLWVSETGLNAKAAAVIAELKKANEWGLKASDFDVRAAAAASGEGAGLSRDQLAEAEMSLSLAVLEYARYARGGRITEPARQLSSYLDRMPQLRDPKTVLEEIAAATEADSYLRGLHPKHPQFEKLRQRYLELVKSAAVAAEIVKIPKGPKLVPGQKHPQVALLRQRLGVALPSVTPPDETLYDDALAAAVKEFQTKKELKPDGIVSAATREALNDIEAPSPAKLLANMEEWRWMPEDLGAFYVWVNIPEFTLRVVKDGKIVHAERVITGLVDKQTPVFSDEMELVTFHPRWIVPDSIKVRELYPSLARGGTTFAKQNLKLTRNGRLIDPMSIDWSTTDIRNFDVHQPPGGGNVLGVLKFSFPNKHAVYMHDTPTKGLFEEASRPFSHGCMRVRNAQKLAEVVLGEDKGWSAQQVADMVKAPPEENPITLDHKIPVHITYFTAWIDDEGKEQTARDVYGHEKRITLALEGKFDLIVRGPDHLAPVTYGATRYASSKNTTLDTFMSNLFGGF
jgi:murein L,D-transpeptidase YcbB/YkuD